MDKKLHKALVEQINHEMYSAYLYLAMAAYSEAQDLPGIGSWFKAQAKEEMGHAMKFYEFIGDRGEAVVLESIAKPPAKFGTPLETYKAALAHEKKVTGLINKLVDGAKKANDHAAEIFLQWFVTEQVEEEKTASDIIAILQRIKPDSGQMVMIDVQLGKRQ